VASPARIEFGLKALPSLLFFHGAFDEQVAVAGRATSIIGRPRVVPNVVMAQAALDPAGAPGACAPLNGVK
jgi:hypothetical protein